MASWMILSRVYTSFLWMNVKVKTNSWKKFGSEYFHNSRHHCFPQQIIVAGFYRQNELAPRRGSHLSTTKCDYSVYFPAVFSYGNSMCNQLEIKGSTSCKVMMSRAFSRRPCNQQICWHPLNNYCPMYFK